MFQKNKSID